MKEVPVSAVVIAKNEEKRIARCLESIRWADEIIVVDGCSTDRTAEIAASFGAKVIPHKFTGSFADDRNIGLENARNEWVLQLDADDVVTEGFQKKVKELLPADPYVAVYKFRRKNFFLGHSMDHGGFHHFIPNLVNKRCVKFTGDVHEVPEYTGKIGTIDADIEHYPFDSIGQFVMRQDRYTDIAAKDLLKREGIVPEKRIRKEMMGRTWKLFWKSYVKKQGFREGIYGLVFAALFASINFLKWAKYWELIRNESRE